MWVIQATCLQVHYSGKRIAQSRRARVHTGWQTLLCGTLLVGSILGSRIVRFGAIASRETVIRPLLRLTEDIRSTDSTDLAQVLVIWATCARRCTTQLGRWWKVPRIVTISHWNKIFGYWICRVTQRIVLLVIAPLRGTIGGQNQEEIPLTYDEKRRLQIGLSHLEDSKQNP